MPLHRATHEDASALVDQLEQDGHQVVALTSDEGGVYFATIKKPKVGRPPKGTETR